MDNEYNRNYLEELAYKLKAGTITPQEQQYFDFWYNQHKDELLELPGDKTGDARQIRDKMHGQILRHVQDKKTTAPVRPMLVRVMAAAAGLLLFSSILFVYLRSNKINNRAIPRQVSYVAPGTDKAILTLSNGKQIALGDNSGPITGAAEAAKIHNSGGRLIYTGGDTESGAVQLNAIDVPKGGQYQVQLPDGSQVWLNADSHLEYPAGFTGTSRSVTLRGEAYFEVAHDPGKPFLVKTGKQEVRVLGTHFNIKAYPDEPGTTTTLLEGSVRLIAANTSALLIPGQQSVFQSEKFSVTPADVSVAVAWKNGMLSYRKAKITTMLRDVSRWYNIPIVYEGKEPDFTISGDVSRKEDLSAVLRMLRLSEVHFEQQDRKLTIKN